MRPAQTRDRDLADALRAELAAIEPVRSCCRRAERDGLGSAAAGRARSPVVARLAARLAARDGGPTTSSSFEWTRAADHCRMAWLRGTFLAHGSLSLSGGSHLELVVPPSRVDVLAARLSEIGLSAPLRVRRGQGVITWKGRDKVLTFLRRAGASAAALELESRAITRTLGSDLNRVLNAENANLKRSAEASTRQIAAIEQLEGAGRLERLPGFERDLVRLRRAEPGHTISDLAAQLSVSRGRVQRSLERVESMAEAIRPEPTWDDAGHAAGAHRGQLEDAHDIVRGR